MPVFTASLYTSSKSQKFTKTGQADTNYQKMGEKLYQLSCFTSPQSLRHFSNKQSRSQESSAWNIKCAPALTQDFSKAFAELLHISACAFHLFGIVFSTITSFSRWERLATPCVLEYRNTMKFAFCIFVLHHFLLLTFSTLVWMPPCTNLALSYLPQ